MTGWQFLAREHSSSAFPTTMTECIALASPTLSTYLNCMVVSCHHNIGCRRWETTKHGWEIFAHCCVLHWFVGQKTVPFHTLTNTPIFHMASSSSTYRAFAATFKAMEAPFFRRETALQLPGQWFPREYTIPEEFVAKEDLHRGKKKSINAVDKDDDTVPMLNLPPPPHQGRPLQRVHPTRAPHLRSESATGQGGALPFCRRRQRPG